MTSNKHQLVEDGNIDILLIREIDNSIGTVNQGWAFVEMLGLPKEPFCVLFKDNYVGPMRESGIWFELLKNGWVSLGTKDPIEAINMIKSKYYI